MELKFQLVFDDGTPVKPRSPTKRTIMEVKPAKPFISLDGFSKDVQVRLLESSCFHGNRPFFLKVCQAPSQLPPRVRVDAAVSAALHAMFVEGGKNGTGALYLETRWRIFFTKNLPKKWYKDQGGRDNHMEMQLELRDAYGNAVPCPRKNRVLIKLLYKKSTSDKLEELPAHSQKILKLLPTSKREIDENGKVRIKFRIDDVSKNHMKRHFHLQVTPKVLERLQRDDFSLAGDVSSGVNVLSKVNGPRMKSRSAPTRIAKPGSFSFDIQFGKEKHVSTPVQAAGGYRTWMVATRNLLNAVQWKCVGFEFTKLVASGERLDIDYTRPIYSCPSCKAMINTETYTRCKSVTDRGTVPPKAMPAVQEQLLALHRFMALPAWANLSRTLHSGESSLASSSRFPSTDSGALSSGRGFRSSAIQDRATSNTDGTQTLASLQSAAVPERPRPELRAQDPPPTLYRILAADTRFFPSDKVGEFMYPAFDIAGNLLGFVLGQCYYPKGCYEGLDTPASLSRLRVMLEQTQHSLNYTLNDPRGYCATPYDLIQMIASHHQGWRSFCVSR